MSLTERLLKNSSLKGRGSILSESKTIVAKELCSTNIPMLNVALSGKLDGGFGSGLTVLAGPSRHFKSGIGLVMVASYLKKYPDAACLFYDSEFGTTTDYFENFGVDSSRVIHIPVMDIEELKFDMIKQLDELTADDKVIIFIDSVGNLASKKELEDAKDGKSVADMTRAKSLKALWRMVTPYFNLKDIPCIAISHTYDTQEMFSKKVISGGTGIMYNANTAFIFGKRQNKNGTELIGNNFVINVEKSRFVREKSKIDLNVTFENGIDKWTGLLEVALETGHVVKPSNGFYMRAHIKDDKKVREKATHCAEFWMPVFQDTDFPDAVAKKFSLSNGGQDEE